MATDPVSARTEFTLHDDVRLLAAVDAVIAYSGQRSGLSAEAQSQLSTAVLEASRQALAGRREKGGASGAAPSIKIIVEDFPDRVEVSLDPGPPATPAAAPAGSPKVGVDVVKTESLEGRPRLILIQYVAGHAPKIC
ncbi:MAG: hypothetical protein WBS18_06895 [Candidatus Acidiferrales bacterium]